MKNKGIIKLAGALAAISLFLFPVAGCGPFSFSGLDLLTEAEVSIVFKLILGLAILIGVAIIFLREKTQTFIAGISGLAVLIGLYVYFKMKMKSLMGDSAGNSLGSGPGSGPGSGLADSMSTMATNAIEIKFGSYLAILSFIAAAVVSKLKNEIIPGAQAAPAIPPPTIQVPAPDAAPTTPVEEKPE